MPKIPKCDRCQYFLHSPYLICAVNPHGPDGSTCEDFAAISEMDAAANKQPLGGGYYLGDWIPQPFPAVPGGEQLALLDWHPQFTGRCPNCEMPVTAAAAGQWKCGHCDWQESVIQNMHEGETTN